MSGENENNEQVPLLDRVEMPEIPKEATRDIALLEKQFTDAEVTASMLSLFLYFSLFLLVLCCESFFILDCRG